MGKLICGVAVNDAGYKVYRWEMRNGKVRVTWRCPFYQTWSRMIRRCYGKSFQKRCPSYIGCSVCDDWLSFSNFRRWMDTQDWEGKHLDKDLMKEGNRVYSPESCAFISPKLNNFLVNGLSRRGEFPIGVSLQKSTGKYVAHCKNPFEGKGESLGVYETPAEAHQAWRERKYHLACQYAEEISDDRIAISLIKRFEV